MARPVSFRDCRGRATNRPTLPPLQRRNAQGLDLNRDHMKLESPEARALVRAYADYDPHVVIDLHTTNGTQHAYHLTYAPPLHPNTYPAINALLRDEWLPAVTDAVRASDRWEFYHYGNVRRAPSRAGAHSITARGSTTTMSASATGSR